MRWLSVLIIICIGATTQPAVQPGFGKFPFGSKMADVAAWLKAEFSLTKGDDSVYTNPTDPELRIVFLSADLTEISGFKIGDRRFGIRLRYTRNRLLYRYDIIAASGPSDLDFLNQIFDQKYGRDAHSVLDVPLSTHEMYMDLTPGVRFQFFTTELRDVWRLSTATVTTGVAKEADAKDPKDSLAIAIVEDTKLAALHAKEMDEDDVERKNRDENAVKKGAKDF